MLLSAPSRFTCLLLLAAGSWTFAQEIKLPDAPERVHVAPPPSDRFPASWYPQQGREIAIAIAPTLDRPYSATVENVTLLPTPTGESQQFVSKGFQARDRFGRSRSESVDGGMTIEGQTFKTKRVDVVDPVSHCQFHWTAVYD